MDLKKYTVKLDSSTLANKILLMLLVLTLMICIVEAVLIYKIRNDARIVLVPPTIQNKFYVSGTQVSDSYLKQIGLFLLQLKLNVTPKTVDTTHAVFEDYVDSKIYGQVEADLLKEAKLIKNDDISADFIPTSVTPDAAKLLVKISGYLNKSVGKRKIPTELVTYLMQFSYKTGTLHLTGIEKVANS